jgi:hypothetical protein
MNGMRRGFANRRRWGEFVSAVQCSVSYPAVINALRSGARWFNDGLQRVSPAQFLATGPISLNSR